MRLVLLSALLALAVPVGAAAAPITIPGPLDGPLPRFEGKPAKKRPLDDRLPASNPVLARNGRNGSGLAPGNGGFSPYPGPLGHGTTRLSATQLGTCASLAFGDSGQLLAVCNGPTGPSLRAIDPVTLDTLAAMTLPIRPNADRTDTSGGTHFIVRADGSLLLPANDQSIHTIAVGPTSLVDTGRIKLAGLLHAGEQPFAVGAGFDGFDWVVGNRGTVATLSRPDGSVQSLDLGENVAEDIATDSSGTYVVTRSALYRLRANDSGKPRIIWRKPLASAGPDPHAGRVHQGSGTPPAIVEGRYVAVADAQNPPTVRVYDLDRGTLHCSRRVFKGGNGSVEAQLVVAGRGIVAANQYGYDGLPTTELGGTSDGGLERIDVTRGGCRSVWKSDEISPSAQPVVSRATGLLYTLVKPAGFPDAWNLAAIDWRTGRFRFAALSGEGLGFNSEGGAVALGPDGSAYAGSFAGVSRFADKP